MSHRAGPSFFEAKRPWSKYKDTVLSYYLRPYLAKVRKIGRPILLVDLFAGAGRFDDGSLGSPLLLLEAAKDLASSRFPIKVLLVEQDKGLAHELRRNVAAFEELADVRNSDCLDLIDEMASAVKTRTVFLYVDPFTIRRLHLGKLGRVYSGIQSGSSVELLFVFMGPTFLRWARKCLGDEELSLDVLGDRMVVDEEGNFDRMMADALWDASTALAAQRAKSSADELDAIAGGRYWRAFASQQLTPEIHRQFAGRYCEELRRWFPSVCSFPIYSSDNSRVPKYWMIFGTRFRPALDLINRAMARARNEEYQHWLSGGLFAETGPPMLPIRPDEKRLLLERLQDVGPITWDNLRWDVTEQATGWFTDTEWNRAIKSLLRAGSIRGASGEKVEGKALLQVSRGATP